MQKRIALFCILAISACAPQRDIISLAAAPDQQAMIRDGVPALVSSKKHAVFLRPTDARQESGGRPKFVVAMLNRGNAPATFNMSDMRVEMLRPRHARIKLYTHMELADEVETERNTRLFLAALSGAAGAMSAASAGTTYTNASYTHHSPYGTGTGFYTASTYNPGLAQSAINANNDRTLDSMAAIEAGAENALANLKATILKDHTLMPGEWHGGVIVLDPPEMGEEGTEYQITLRFDGEEHVFTVNQRGGSGR